VQWGGAGQMTSKTMPLYDSRLCLIPCFYTPAPQQDPFPSPPPPPCSSPAKTLVAAGGMLPAQPSTSAVTCSAKRAAGTSAAAARPLPTSPAPPLPACPPPVPPLPPPPPAPWGVPEVERWPGVGVAPRVAAARPPASATLGRKASGLSRAAPILHVGTHAREGLHDGAIWLGCWGTM
jgi:hypothetical protein